MISSKKIWIIIYNIIELYIPVVTFFVMFITFVIQIFFRYFLNNPLNWAYEFTLLTYMWTVLFAACYARRKNQHICFSMIYDRSSQKTKIKMRLIGNSIIILAFCILFYPAYDYVSFMIIQKTPVLDVPYNLAFTPFLILIISILAHSIYDVITDFQKLQVLHQDKND
jgi:TRAP-type C4-dicarboxylate transport system permease small subunit